MVPESIKRVLDKYVENVKKIYGNHITKILLYGSYARGDYDNSSDVDIMILLDINDMELKRYRKELSYMTCDFNLDNDIDISPFAKSQEHFNKWVINYPFYKNVDKEGVVLYG